MFPVGQSAWTWSSCQKRKQHQRRETRSSWPNCNSSNGFGPSGIAFSEARKSFVQSVWMPAEPSCATSRKHILGAFDSHSMADFDVFRFVAQGRSHPRRGPSGQALCVSGAAIAEPQKKSISFMRGRALSSWSHENAWTSGDLDCVAAQDCKAVGRRLRVN